MIEGCVMQCKGKWVIVLTADGQYVKIPKKHHDYQVGELLQLSPAQLARQPQSTLSTFCWKHWRKALPLLLAAVFLLVLLPWGESGFQPEKELVAYVTLDVNPSIELGVDGQRQVLSWRGLNEDGERLLTGVQLEKGEELHLVLARLFVAMARDGVLHDTVLFSSTLMQENQDTDWEAALETEMATAVQAINQERSEPVQSVLVKGDVSVRQHAQQEKLSTGKYLLYLHAKEREEESITIEEWQAYPVKEMLAKASLSPESVSSDADQGSSKNALESEQPLPPSQGEKQGRKGGQGKTDQVKEEKQQWKGEVKREKEEEKEVVKREREEEKEQAKQEREEEKREKRIEKEHEKIAKEQEKLVKEEEKEEQKNEKEEEKKQKKLEQEQKKLEQKQKMKQNEQRDEKQKKQKESDA